MAEGGVEQRMTGIQSVAADVFLSYASPDAGIADAVCGALEGERVSCWIAPRDVVPGEFYADAIVHAIDAAKVVVLVLSEHAVASPHVIREIERATSKRCPIVTLRLEPKAMPPALEYFLNASHWLEASASGIQAALPRLVAAVKRLTLRGADPIDVPAARQATPAATRGTNSIAVLPFANMSPEPDQEYFSDGLAEEIINLLAHVPGLKVIARTSAFAFRGKEQDIREIAEVLGVTHVLEGSVRRAGNRLRITGQLIHAVDGTHLWSQRYDRELSDIFAVQDEISAAIVGALRVRLSGDAASQRYTPNLTAYEAYLKARYLQAKVTPESQELARRCYEQAIEADAAFAMAHVGLAHYWLAAMTFNQCPAHEGVPAARAQANRALQIDPSLADAHALLGFLAGMYELDWTTAERHFDFPLAKDASFAMFRPLYGGLQFLRGNAEEAAALARCAIDQDPLDVWPRMNLQAYSQAAGREEDALEQQQKVLELDEHQVVALVAMALIYADRGDLAQALAIARRAHAIASWYPDAAAVLAALLRRNGQAAESQSLVQALGSGEALGGAHVQALYHLLCGDIDLGADWVEKAIDQRDLAMMIYVRFVVCKDLRASHRWPKIARMLNLPDKAAPQG